MKVVIVSGGFDPIHSGHIQYLLEAKKLGDILIVALNSDEWLIEKKGKEFMPFEERKVVLENISCVDQVIGFEDDDLGSCINVAINYGGREEIVDTTKKIIEDVISVDGDAQQIKKLESINEEVIRNNSYLPVIPEPELLIRTGGHSRVSNFLLWHIAYSEIDICDKLWPDFNAEDFNAVLDDFKTRQRRFGK